MSDLDRYAPQAWELVSQHLDDIERSIIADACKAVNDGIDPQYAVQQWIALAEARKLKQKLERGVRGHRAEASRAARVFDKKLSGE